MTSLSLILWIAFGIGAQLALFFCIAFWRHWQNYAAIKDRASDSVAPAAMAPAVDTDSGGSWVGFRAFKVVQKVFEDRAQSICSVYLEAEDRKPLPAFLPGQFLTFRLEIPTPAGATEQIVRCYSLSDAPQPETYRVSIKRVPEPLGSAAPPGKSSNYFHDHVEVGSILQVRAPAGHFHIDRGDAPAVLVAGGIGITPAMSMLNACIAMQPQREIWLYYGVRNSREVAMKAHLEAVAAAHPNLHLRLCFSNPLADDRLGQDYQHRGRIDVALFRAQLPLKPYHFYICGPTAMLESLVPALDDWGVPDAHIHFEAFGPASIKRKSTAAARNGMEPGSASGIVVTFARSGKQLPWQASAGSLLDFAEANGVTVDSGCRAGGCGSCQTTIKSGAVAYRQSPDFDPEPGNCLLCICTPKTSVTLEA